MQCNCSDLSSLNQEVSKRSGTNIGLPYVRKKIRDSDVFFPALLLAHWFQGGPGSDEVQDELMGVPLHSGGYITAHLGTTGNINL